MATASTEPPNSAIEPKIGSRAPTVEFEYAGHKILAGRFSVNGDPEPWKSVTISSKVDRGNRGEITQTITLHDLTGKSIHLDATIDGSDQTLAAETQSAAQERFKLVRNSVGPSDNLRNNAIYDRSGDWMIEGAGDGATRIVPEKTHGSRTSFRWSASGPRIDLTFRPRYYQLHKNIASFRPWEYNVWKGSVTGWCSWWAYFTDIHEKDVEQISRIFSDKLKDYGYRYIQIDDGYQSSGGGLPTDWLHTNDRFPSGLRHLAKSIADHGLEPALWTNVHFGDAKFVEQHPDWFVQDANGKPHKGPWIDYGLDASNKAAVDAVIRPLYSALHDMGWRYVKVDALRHLLYDASYPCREYFASKGIKLEDAFRDYLKAIRQELGPDTYMLACWGVLPEVVGIANGCRLGGDGFGPSTLQQYTSWNNVVWRNDPDHCDVKPLDHQTNRYIDGEERIRPVLVSMAGAQLLLSDKPEVYENDANLEGVKRSSPILFTVPGQLYDYDPVKTDHLKQGLRNDNGGAQSGPIDADQRGEVSPWWMLDINEPFESWTILTHMNWDATPMAQSTVKFHDLGLPGAKYAVFEFWSKKYLGDFSEEFTAKMLDAKEVSTYAIRRIVDHPQILSTSRHISQGAVDLSDVGWSASGLVLHGVCHVIRKDPYSLYVRLPAGYSVQDASFGDTAAEVRVEGSLAEVKVAPDSTRSLPWRIRFVRTS